MPFRALVADEEDLTTLVEAFDAAWIEVNRSTPIAPPYRAAAQNRLGEIIVAMWRADSDVLLIERAVAEFNTQSSVPPPGPQTI
ncbi:hypothetical protein [Bosea sp. ANAM02]|uniref:hypothetical protein n=1 Tax=Bosea sp. ANAM02 TaxID=2020412 RepID=UPI00140E9FE3|nr:hypothetical protein [Bosea sp. ANAM02]BCB19228.1 hypothetical protein OCUBac02_21220 [Bosea sp. ANAM02]